MYYRARVKKEQAEEEREGNLPKRKGSFRTSIHAKEDASLCLDPGVFFQHCSCGL